MSWRVLIRCIFFSAKFKKSFTGKGDSRWQKREKQSSCYFLAVATCQEAKCQSSNFLSLVSGAGYLSSQVASQWGCGSKDCPWVLQALPGQRINITLYDFSIAARNTSHNIRHKPGFPQYCQEYAVIKDIQDKDNAVPTSARSAIVCGGEQRVKVAYVSTSHKVQVNLVTRKPGRNLEYFMFKFEGQSFSYLPHIACIKKHFEMSFCMSGQWCWVKSSHESWRCAQNTSSHFCGPIRVSFVMEIRNSNKKKHTCL